MHKDHVLYDTSSGNIVSMIDIRGLDQSESDKVNITFDTSLRTARVSVEESTILMKTSSLNSNLSLNQKLCISVCLNDVLCNSLDVRVLNSSVSLIGVEPSTFMQFDSSFTRNLKRSNSWQNLHILKGLSKSIKISLLSTYRATYIVPASL